MPAPPMLPGDSYYSYVKRIGAESGIVLTTFPRNPGKVHGSDVYIYTDPETPTEPVLIGATSPLCRSNTGFNHYQGRIVSKAVADSAPYEQRKALRDRITCGTCLKRWTPRPPDDLRAE